MNDFEKFPKIPRLNRPIVLTEKIDGTNAQIFIVDRREFKECPVWVEQLQLAWQDELLMFAGSRSRYLQLGKQDNYGFARWVQDNSEELFKLGPGRHFGEWWGGGIQRGYGLQKGEKRFSLFNVSRWATDPNIGNPDFTWPPECCHVVPILGGAPTFQTSAVTRATDWLRNNGSAAAPGFDKPEGVMIFHTAGNLLFKVTLEKDEEWKGKQS